MDFRRDQFTRTARAPAKLNLYLEVFGRRGDGYHELATLMVPISLFDQVSLVATAPTSTIGPAIEFDVSTSSAGQFDGERETIPTGGENLVVRALELLRERSGCQQGAAARLVKRIPSAAGLGGGSSDAAAALLLANHAWKLNWSRERLAALAAEIGSDVPYFLSGGVGVCRGRGERVEKLPAVKRLNFVVVKPPVDLRTADVYRAYDALADYESPAVAVKGPEALIAALVRGRLTEIGRMMRNALEAAAATLSPWVERVRSAFDKLDCLAHQLSGSGSAYFGLCRHWQHASRLACVLRARRLGCVYAVRSCP